MTDANGNYMVTGLMDAGYQISATEQGYGRIFWQDVNDGAQASIVSINTSNGISNIRISSGGKRNLTD